MTIGQILKRRSGELFTITADKTLKQAAEALYDKKIGALPVVDISGVLIGIISERDIVRICAKTGSAALDSLVSNAMSTNLETAKPSDSIDMALARMTDRRIRHLPVLESKKLVGIVSIGDLVKAQIDAVIAEADAMRAYIHS